MCKIGFTQIQLVQHTKFVFLSPLWCYDGISIHLVLTYQYEFCKNKLMQMDHKGQ